MPDKKRKTEFMTSLIANVPCEDFKQARNDKVDIIRATKILGSNKVKADGNGNWSMKGMRSALYHYQVQGAAFMKNREIGDDDVKGGLLCDQMGLGKTVQVIANMVAHRQTGPAYTKCTLVSAHFSTKQTGELATHKPCLMSRCCIVVGRKFVSCRRITDFIILGGLFACTHDTVGKGIGETCRSQSLQDSHAVSSQEPSQR